MRGMIASVADVVGLLIVIAALLVMLMAGQNTIGWQPESTLFAEGSTYSSLLLFIAGVSIVVGLLQSSRRTSAAPWRNKLPNGEVRRHTLDSILVHWGNTLGFLVCTYSALVLLKWVGNSLNLSTIYHLHYLGAALMLIAAVSYAVHHQVAADTGLVPRKGDLRAALTEILEYADVVGDGKRTFLGLRLPSIIRRPLNALARWTGLAQTPHPGKYLPTEKALSFSGWTILMTLVVLTGIVKLGKYAFAVPGELLRWSTLVHDAVVPLLLVALVMHVLAVVLVPANLALLRSMFTGRVPGHYVKEHHPVWHAELEQELEGQEVPAKGVREPAV